MCFRFFVLLAGFIGSSAQFVAFFAKKLLTKCILRKGFQENLPYFLFLPDDGLQRLAYHYGYTFFKLKSLCLCLTHFVICHR